MFNVYKREGMRSHHPVFRQGQDNIVTTKYLQRTRDTTMKSKDW